MSSETILYEVDKLLLGVHIELHVDVLDVGLHGAVRQGGLVADGSSVTAAGKQGAQLYLALGKTMLRAAALLRGGGASQLEGPPPWKSDVGNSKGSPPLRRSDQGPLAQI